MNYLIRFLEIIKPLLKKLERHKGKLEIILIGSLFAILTSIYLFPLFQGLMVLPLDLLVSSYAPWYSPGTILLKNPYMQDSILQMFPWHHLVFQSLTAGIIPFWNPYQLMGAPFMASMKPMVFYPFNLLFIFGEINSWNLLLFSQILFSSFFFYFLARDFKLSIIPSVLAALAFALSSLMIGVLEFGSEGHVILWIPLFLLFSKRYLDSSKGRYLFLTTLVITFSILAGQLQFTAYGLVMLGFFVLAYGLYLKTPLKKFILVFMSILLGIIISSFQLIPGFELFSYSHRGLMQSAETFNSGLMNPVFLLRLLSPDFFGNPVSRDAAIGYIETSGYFGAIPLFFCFYALFAARKNFIVKFFAAVFIVAILLSVQYIGSILYLLKIPLITSGSGGRIFVLVIFAGALLSAFGLSYFVKAKIREQLFSLLVFALTMSVIFASRMLLLGNLSQVKDFIHNVNAALIILPVFLVVSFLYLIFQKRIPHADRLFMALVILLTFMELFRFGYRFLTFSNTKFFYPKINATEFIKNYSKESLARVYGYSEPELPTLLNIYTIETYNPLYLLRNGTLLQAMQGKSGQPLSLDNKYFLDKQEPLKETLDFLGTSLVATGENGNPSTEYFQTDKYQNNFDQAYTGDKYSIYINKSAFPRFYLVYDYQVLNNDSQILSEIERNTASLKTKVILEEDPEVKLTLGKGAVELLKSNVNMQEFRITTDKQAIFYISDTYFPGWTAKVNKTNVKIYRANYNFRAIIIPAGQSIVQFSYVPQNFYIAVIISIVGLFGLVIISILAKKIQK